MNVLELSEKLWSGEVDTRDHHPFGAAGGLVEVTEDVVFVPASRTSPRSRPVTGWRSWTPAAR
jgi:hypothetical protein